MCSEVIGLGFLIVLQGIDILSSKKQIRKINEKTNGKLNRVIEEFERPNRSCAKINESTIRMSNETSNIGYDLKKMIGPL